jgi:chemotaxis protein methyltransferase CheR
MLGNGSLQANLAGVTLEIADFNRVRNLIYSYSGINLQEGKQALVRARLMKRLRKLNIDTFSAYLDYIESKDGSAEFLAFVDVLTTNKTHFFRENRHFEFIRDKVAREVIGQNKKWWSAGCSSGEEAVTLAITLREALGRVNANPKVKILATDLSREVLRIAKLGEYPDNRMSDVPAEIKRSYFKKNSEVPDNYIVNKQIMDMITYGRLNLLAEWPLKGPFHVIMCRNVMIYFDRKTQQKLISRFYRLLEPGGYLFLGHSESVSGKDHSFVNILPAVYQKPGGDS